MDTTRSPVYCARCRTRFLAADPRAHAATCAQRIEPIDAPRRAEQAEPSAVSPSRGARPTSAGAHDAPIAPPPSAAARSVDPSPRGAVAAPRPITRASIELQWKPQATTNRSEPRREASSSTEWSVPISARVWSPTTFEEWESAVATARQHLARRGAPFAFLATTAHAAIPTSARRALIDACESTIATLAGSWPKVRNVVVPRRASGRPGLWWLIRRSRLGPHSAGDDGYTLFANRDSDSPLDIAFALTESRGELAIVLEALLVRQRARAYPPPAQEFGGYRVRAATSIAPRAGHPVQMVVGTGPTGFAPLPELEPPDERTPRDFE